MSVSYESLPGSHMVELGRRIPDNAPIISVGITPPGRPFATTVVIERTADGLATRWHLAGSEVNVLELVRWVDAVLDTVPEHLRERARK